MNPKTMLSEQKKTFLDPKGPFLNRKSPFRDKRELSKTKTFRSERALSKSESFRAGKDPSEPKKAHSMPDGPNGDKRLLSKPKTVFGDPKRFSSERKFYL